MKRTEFQKFIDLVTFDQNLITLQNSIAQAQVVYKRLVEDLNRLHDEFADLSQEKINARKAVDEKELYMKVLDQKEAEIREKLQVVKNQKEYKALEKEHEKIKLDRLDHEKDLLRLWNSCESVEKEYQQHQESYDKKVAEINQQIEIEKSKNAEAEKEVTAFSAKREEKEREVSQELLDIYATMRGRVVDPVAPVVQDSCGSCFYMITMRDLQKLRQNQLLQCRDCYRLLYINAEEVEEAQAEHDKQVEDARQHTAQDESGDAA